MHSLKAQTKLNAYSLLSKLCPKPCNRRFMMDVIYLLLVITLQVTILPSILSVYCIDLLSPWLAIIFVVYKAPRSMLLALIGSLTYENHSSVPAGLYFSAYWVLGILIILVKNHLSWRNILPWVTTAALSEFWIILFESFVSVLKNGHSIFTAHDLLMIIIRLIIATALGFAFATEGQKLLAEDKNF